VPRGFRRGGNLRSIDQFTKNYHWPASLCHFFENGKMKLKFPYLLKPLGTIIQQNYWPFYPSEPFSLDQFNMIHPVGTQNKKNFWNPWRDSWGPHPQGMAISALSEKMPKWHFLIHAWNLNFLGKMTSTKVLWKCHYLTSSKKCPRLRPSAYLRG
jgi:hypothetical protein